MKNCIIELGVHLWASSSFYYRKQILKQHYSEIRKKGSTQLQQAANHKQKQTASLEPIVQLRQVVKVTKHWPVILKALKGNHPGCLSGGVHWHPGQIWRRQIHPGEFDHGADHLTGGEIWVNGEPVYKYRENEIALWPKPGRGLPILSTNAQSISSIMSCYPWISAGQFRIPKSANKAMELLRQVKSKNMPENYPDDLRRAAATRGHRPRPGQRPAHHHRR